MSSDRHKIEDLIALFRECFLASTNTELVRGYGDPVYYPADENRIHNQVVFANGFFASGLHEIAHWTIAGRARRQLVDYGYWYKPDGRNRDEQEEFFRVESKPQAIEWILADACAMTFHISADNLEGDPGDQDRFYDLVLAHKETYLTTGLPPRAEQFRQKLASFYGTPPTH